MVRILQGTETSQDRHSTALSIEFTYVRVQCGANPAPIFMAVDTMRPVQCYCPETSMVGSHVKVCTPCALWSTDLWRFLACCSRVEQGWARESVHRFTGLSLPWREHGVWFLGSEAAIVTVLLFCILGAGFLPSQFSPNKAVRCGVNQLGHLLCMRAGYDPIPARDGTEL